MTRCDSCGVDFEMPKEPVEVTSSKVLCPKCAAERKARIQANKAAAAAAAGKPAAPAATPAPAAKPATPPPAAPKPAAAAPAPAAKPAARPAAAAKAAPAKAAAGKELHHYDHAELKRLRQQELNNIIKWGWIIAGSLLLIGGIIVLLVYSKHKDDRAEEAARLQELLDIRNELAAYDLKTEDGAQKARDVALKNMAKLKRSQWEQEVNRIRADADTALLGFKMTREIKDKLSGIEAQLKGSPSVEILLGIFGQVRELKTEADAASPQIAAQLADLRAKADSVLVETLKQKVDAEAQSAKQGADLVAHGQLEDVLGKLTQEAMLAKDTDGLKKYGELFKVIYKQTNAIVGAMFTPEYLARVKDKDLLTGDPAAWVSGNSSSLKKSITGTSLILTNEEGQGAKIDGIYYDPAMNWRDYVVEMEVKIDSGFATFYTRASNPDEPKQAFMDTQKVPGVSFGKEKANINLPEYGKVMQVTMSVIGRDFAVIVDGSPQPVDELSYSKSRRGPIAISCKPGSTVTITKLKVKHLR